MNVMFMPVIWLLLRSSFVLSEIDGRWGGSDEKVDNKIQVFYSVTVWRHRSRSAAGALIHNRVLFFHHEKLTL